MSADTGETIGYWYFMGMQMVLCHGPVDTVHDLLVGERSAFSGISGVPASSSTRIYIFQHNLFGGEKREGGLSGYLSLAFGEPTQAPNPYLQGQLGADIPAYRGVLSAIWEGGRLAAMNPYIKKWEFVVSRASPEIPGGGAWKTIGDDNANPAYMIYESLTNEAWGMGYPSASMDPVSFLATAEALFNEGFGLSLTWSQQASIEDFVQEIVDHIAGQLRLNLETGLHELHLIRKVTDLSGVRTLDEDTIVEIPSFERQGWGETVNEVTVKYIDPSTFKETAVTVQDLGNIAVQGATVNQTLEFLGIRDNSLAQLVALRELAARSTPLAVMTLKLNKKAWDLRPGDIFKLTWAALGVVDMACRCLTIDTGQAGSGVISVQAIEDVFYMGSTAYTDQQPEGWVNPNTAPVAPSSRFVEEGGYYDLALRIGDTDAQAEDANVGYVTSVAVKPSGDSYNYNMMSRVAPQDYGTDGTGHWGKAGVLNAALDFTTEVFQVTQLGISDLLNAVLNPYAYVGSEKVKLLSITSVSGSIYEVTVKRGVLDTVPVEHPSGTVFWAVDDSQPAHPQPYTNLDSVNVQLRTLTSLGELSEADSLTDVVVMGQRQYRPYPPGGLTINGVYLQQSITGDLAVSWAHRDRLLQTAYLVEQSESSIGPEVGTTYEVWITDELSNVNPPFYVGAGTTATLTQAQEGTDNGLGRYNTSLILHVKAIRDGLDSWTEWSIPITRP